MGASPFAEAAHPARHPILRMTYVTARPAPGGTMPQLWQPKMAGLSGAGGREAILTGSNLLAAAFPR